MTDAVDIPARKSSSSGVDCSVGAHWQLILGTIFYYVLVHFVLLIFLATNGMMPCIRYSAFRVESGVFCAGYSNHRHERIRPS